MEDDKNRLRVPSGEDSHNPVFWTATGTSPGYADVTISLRSTTTHLPETESLRYNSLQNRKLRVSGKISQSVCYVYWPSQQKSLGVRWYFILHLNSRSAHLAGPKPFKTRLQILDHVRETAPQTVKPR